MKEQLHALKAEFLKLKHSRIVWVTFIAFALAPLMGGVFLLIMRNPDAMANTGSLNAKIKMMGMAADWRSYLNILTQAIGVGGVLIFGFVASWLFGREYTDGTAKDLFSLPASKTSILNAKFAVYLLWCVLLAVSNLLVGLLIGLALQLPLTDTNWLAADMSTYWLTGVMTIIIGSPIALFAIWGRGYMAPLGFVALTLVFAQVIGAAGYGAYFPWSVPGLYSGSGGDYKEQLNGLSYCILVLMSIAGYFATVLYWRYADQKK
ncbi:MAG: ABC transporter permease [Chitinophagales bacterium]|nr:ABC transporter permease [Chitinophagales bacterium]